jgi:hypothetical protein
VLAFVMAVGLQSLQFVYTDYLIRPPHNLDEASLVLWPSFYCVFIFILSIPIENVEQINALPESKPFSWAWNNQAGAFRCLVGQSYEDEYPSQCTSKSAWVWVTAYGVSYVFLIYFSNVLYKKTSAFWTTLLQTLMAPLSAVVFNYPQLVGDYNYAPFTPFAGASFAVILVGVCLLGAPADKPSLEANSEQLPLLVAQNPEKKSDTDQAEGPDSADSSFV